MNMKDCARGEWFEDRLVLNAALHPIALLMFTLLILLCSPKALADEHNSIQIAQKYICVIHGSRSDKDRLHAAKKLSDLTEVHGALITERQIRQISSFLNDPNEGIVIFASDSIGNIGPRAKLAVQSLEEVLEKYSCASGDVTPYAGAAYALKKIGGKIMYKKCFPPDHDFSELSRVGRSKSLPTMSLLSEAELFSECSSIHHSQ
jgi:hypothetical protein